MIFHNLLQRLSLSNDLKVKKHHFFFWHHCCRTLMDDTPLQRIFSSGREWVSPLLNRKRHCLLTSEVFAIVAHNKIPSSWSFFGVAEQKVTLSFNFFLKFQNLLLKLISWRGSYLSAFDLSTRFWLGTQRSLRVFRRECLLNPNNVLDTCSDWIWDSRRKLRPLRGF